HKSDVLDRWCEKEGRDPTTIKRSLNLGFYLAPTQAQGAAATEKLRRDMGDRTAGALVGGPQDVVEQVGRFADAGVTALNIAFRPPVDWDALQALVEEVVHEIA